MKEKIKLSKSMTIAQFDAGYWYAKEIKAFAKEIGIPSTSRLRKDELEELIKHYLRTNEVKPSARGNLSKDGIKDVEKGLGLNLPIHYYTNDKETKEFIEREALKIAPDHKRKSGARYRLNRWREKQINKGVRITYEDLVLQYIKLNKVKGSFPQAPSGRFVNFLSDFLREEKSATRDEAIHSWNELKKLDLPKNYGAWKDYHKK
ncbi:MAG: SAP domain-containing protein [Saprospiraceae bacterium]|nr:SAP domain-containing protein [Saprospiraceae bacterium]